jgi:hypothetical protein
MNNDTSKLQECFNAYVEDQVQQQCATLLDGPFSALQYPGGFNYMTFNGWQYNHLTLQCMDSLYAVDDDTHFPYIKNDRFSVLYSNILKNTSYLLSQASQKMVDDFLIQCQGQADTVITEYNNAGLPALVSTKQAEAIAEIYQNCVRLFGGAVTEDCSIIPESYFIFKIALQTLNNFGGPATKLVLHAANKNAALASANNNIISPSNLNGGIPIDSAESAYYAGFSRILFSNALIGSLNSVGNAITISITGESRDSQTVNVHVGTESTFVIPILGIIDIEVDHKSSYDMNSLKTQTTKFSAEITYSGLTPVPVVPTTQSADGNFGWFSETDVLSEIRKKTNDNTVDGYKLMGSEFSVDDLFGNELAFLKTILISKTPTVKIKFSNINTNYAKTCFSTGNSVHIKLFGFIDLGNVDHSYTSTNVSYDESEQSVTLTFSAPEPSGTLPADLQTAYVMGGVPYYPGTN